MIIVFFMKVSASELKADLHDLYISAAKELELDGGRKAIIIFVPFRQLKDFHKIQSRLIRELEKKFRWPQLSLLSLRYDILCLWNLFQQPWHWYFTLRPFTFCTSVDDMLSLLHNAQSFLKLWTEMSIALVPAQDRELLHTSRNQFWR